MKKLTALLLAIVLTLSLTGCSLFEPELLGSYQTEVDLRDSVITQFDSGTGLSDTAYSLEHYLTAFPIVIRFAFAEDGTYSVTVDKQSIQTALDGLSAAAAAMIDDYLFQATKAKYASYGLTVETREDIAALVNMSWSELCTSILEVPLDSYVNVIITNSFADTLTAEYHCEGRYKAENGQLHLSEHMDIEPSDEIYETYEINGSTVTFTGAVNLEENTRISYPYTLTQVITPA